jgi:hypothetical protein
MLSPTSDRRAGEQFPDFLPGSSSVSDGIHRGSGRSRRAARLPQIELGISDGRLQRCARHRLNEPALLELELLRLKLSLHRECLAVMIEPPVAYFAGEMHGVAARLLKALELLLLQKLTLHPLMHLELLEATGVGRRQVMALTRPHLPEIEIQGILLLLKLKRAAMRCHAPGICCRRRQ